MADLPIDECEGPKPASERACYGGPCNGETGGYSPEEPDLFVGGLQDFDELYDWEYEGFTECSESCGGGEYQFLIFFVKHALLFAYNQRAINVNLVMLMF